MIKTLFHYLISLFLIFGSLFVGNSIQSALGIAIPGSIIGMLLLFVLLASGIFKVEWIRPGASLFIRHMMFLFVPISVGLMVHLDTLMSNVIPIVASVIGGSLIVMVTLGLILDKYLSRKGD
ncbi:CidA/LrgA family protein [Vibrio salinus]|uniref:CidA/LrgA family protein n=1 Tax=Vibrio salinus TaxID=2899784 RepID=UPI001E5B7389|nr:CidA/LrgA family protein [Vibrio salinus]MCE0496298.1 CidA/LrgA family protein [Vibrio salinus]